MALGDELVTRGTTLLLRAFRAKQVTKARRAAHELALGGEFEPLGNGLLGLLHGERSKTETPPAIGKAFVRRVVSYFPSMLDSRIEAGCRARSNRCRAHR